MKPARLAISTFAMMLNLNCVELEFLWEMPEHLPNSIDVEPVLQGHAKLHAKTNEQYGFDDSTLGTNILEGKTRRIVDQHQFLGASAILQREDGVLMAMSDYGMSDHGVGQRLNPNDNGLRVYLLHVDYHSQFGGSGAIEVQDSFELSDPNGHIKWTIANSLSNDRILTRFDFDIGSMQEAEDNTLWFGDEFGPFLLHTDSVGRLLQAPIPLPDFSKHGKELRSPQNPKYEDVAALGVMNALRQHALNHGNSKVPVISPHHTLLRDGNDRIDHHARGTSTPSGLAPADSEIFDIHLLQGAGFTVVPWTINDTPRMQELIALGVDGIISDRPDLLYKTLASIDVDGDGRSDFLHLDGTIDREKFDAQGHRGARDLRPENTLPAIEAALDALMTTVEIDIGLSSDGVPMVTHDVNILAQKCRMLDGTKYEIEDQVLIMSLLSTEIQDKFICDKLFRGPLQRNDLNLSPVSLEFTRFEELAHPYVMPTLEHLFLFVQAYVDYYRNGFGSSHREAELRWKNAARLRFNIEAKTNPREGKKHLTKSPEEFASAIGTQIMAQGFDGRSNVQSFDFRVPVAVQKQFPQIRTAYLFGDFPQTGSSSRGGGSNIQGENGGDSPWLAGLAWPYRSTQSFYPARVASSGGFEGMAMSPDKSKLYPILEKPLVDCEASEVLIHEFDVHRQRYTGRHWRFELDDRAVSIADFQLLSDQQGVVIGRNESRGSNLGAKELVQIHLEKSRESHSRLRALRFAKIDLLNTRDPGRLISAQTSDMGVGKSFFSILSRSIGSIAVHNFNQVVVINNNDLSFEVDNYVGSHRSGETEVVSLMLNPI